MGSLKMNNRRAIKQKKSRNDQTTEKLEELEKDLNNLKLTMQKKKKHLGQYDKVLKATKIEYQKITDENKKLTEELKKIKLQKI